MTYVGAIKCAINPKHSRASPKVSSSVHQILKKTKLGNICVVLLVRVMLA